MKDFESTIQYLESKMFSSNRFGHDVVRFTLFEKRVERE